MRYQVYLFDEFIAKYTMYYTAVRLLSLTPLRNKSTQCRSFLCWTLILCLNLFAQTTLAQQSSVAAVGLQERVPWTQSRVRGFPDPPLPFALERVYKDLEMPNLLALNRIPNSPYLLAVNHESEWGGPSRVVQFEQLGDGSEAKEFLIRPEIIYGLAFSPGFEKDRFVYVGCNGRSDVLDAVATRVLRFQVTGDGPYVCDPESVNVVIEWPSNGHNGGDIVFGNDGMLYVSAGDGTSDSDQNRTGQDLTKLPGSLLRIDVRSTSEGYTIPPDNPFVQYRSPQNGEAARGEIWAYGLRNPWRISFDSLSGQLWVGNNGQDLWESVYLIEKAANYGWSVRESNHDFHTGQDTGPSPISPATVEHHHQEARSLTGGHVYRGTEYPELVGFYIYGDFSSGNIWAVKHDGQQLQTTLQLARSQAQITGFGLDHDGELLIADHQGNIFQLRRQNKAWRDDFPKKLSETGLFDDVTQEIPTAGVMSYSVNTALWSDGASKSRWFAIPNHETLTYNPSLAWEFPDESVLVKSFAFPDRTTGESRTFETRLLTKQDGQWYGYSYRWNSEQTDAHLIPSKGMDETLDWVATEETHGDLTGGIRWHYPSRTECMVCHSRAAGFVLGFSTAQLDRFHDYESSTGSSASSQLATIHHLGYLGDTPLPSPDRKTVLVDPHDNTQALDDRARSYLHANCSSCHMDAGGGNARIDLTRTADLRKRSKLLDTDPLHGTLGLKDARLLDPGNADNSLLYARMARRGSGQMPPIGTHHVDTKALKLIRDWIEGLNPSP